MPRSGHVIGTGQSQREVPVGLVSTQGMRNSWGNQALRSFKDSCDFKAVSNSAYGTNARLDITNAQTAGALLLDAADCPPGWRTYIEGMMIQVLGPVAWTFSAGTLPGIGIQDGNGNVIATIPIGALLGNAIYAIGTVNEVATPVLIGSGQTLTATYSAAGPTITASATAFVTTTLAGTAVVTIVAGTGAGQSVLIASNTATVLTLAKAFDVAPGASSVFAVSYLTVASTGSTTTDVFTAVGSGIVATGQNYRVGIAGTSIGLTAPYKSFSTVTGTFSYATATASVAGDVVRITTNPSLMGIAAPGIGNIASVAPNTGNGSVVTTAPASNIYGNLLGTGSAGSPVRVDLWGYFAPAISTP